jgi:hypothetical protein
MVVLVVRVGTGPPIRRRVAGWISTAVLVAASILVAAFLSFAIWVRMHKEIASRAKMTCYENEKALARAMLLYVADYDQAFPPADLWCDELATRLPSVGSLICPSARNQNCSYAFLAALGGLNAHAIEDAEHTAMLFESDGGWDAAGGPALLPDRPRHMSGDNYVFADGRVSWMARRLGGTGMPGKHRQTVIWTKGPWGQMLRWKPIFKSNSRGRR